MKTIFKAAVITVGCAMFGSFAFAQQEAPKNKKSEEIIIRKKDAFPQKTIIEIDSSQVTVNGKPISDFNGDITVFKRNFMGPRGNNLFNAPGVNMNLFAPRNKALLGVLTVKSDKGAEIKNVIDSSAAEKAGLKNGDIITKFGDEAINTPDELRSAVSKHNPGDAVTVTYLRNDQQQTTTVKLQKNFADNGFALGNMNDLATPGNGFNFSFPKIPFENFNMNSRSKLGLKIEDTDNGTGAKVLEVQKSSPAEKAGVKAGDIITEMNGEKVSDASDVRSQIMQAENKSDYKLKIKRDKTEKTVEVKIPKVLHTIDI